MKLTKQPGRNLGRAMARFFFALVVLCGGVSGAPAAPTKTIGAAKPGDCKACHGSDRVLPQGHEETEGMNYVRCVSCHSKDGTMPLRGKLPGSHIHQLGGVMCADCHGKTEKPQAVKMKQCETCHSAEKLAAKTESVKPANPHTSLHYGTTLDCNVCHHQHRKSENFCAQCHNFDFKVP